MRVKHNALKDTELNVGGVTVRSDEHGVFDVPDEIGNRLMSLPGYIKPRETVELRKAYVELKKITKLKEQVDADFEQARQNVIVANLQSDRGEGTALDDSEPITEDKPVIVEKEKKSRQPARKPVAEDDDDVDDESEDEADEEETEDEDSTPPVDTNALLMKYKTTKPTMQWRLNDLILFAQAKGIAAESDWTKAQILSELEAQEDE